MLKNFLSGFGAVFAFFLVIGLLDKVETTFTAYNEYRAWVATSCLPTRADEAAIARLGDNGKVDCTVFSNYGYGRAPSVIHAASFELPN
jgi:hypothetical protein